MSVEQLDPLNEAANESILDLLRNVLRQSEPCSKADVVARALLYFLLRVSNTWRSMRTLDTHMPDDDGVMLDAGALVRVMFDAYLQAEYIVSDKTKALVRAQDYLDFEHVERYKQAQKVISGNSPFAKKLTASPERPGAEIRLQQAFDRVSPRYAAAGGQKKGAQHAKVRVRTNWFPGTLADVAQSVGQSEEYAIVLSVFQGCVHSTALSVSQGPPISRRTILTWASKIAAQVAWLNVEHNHIQLNDFQSKMMGTLRRSLLTSADIR